MKCPACGSTEIHPSRRRGLKEGLFLRLILCAPFRCGKCSTRFYAVSRRHSRNQRDQARSLASFLGLSEPQARILFRKVAITLLFTGFILLAIYLVFLLSAPRPE